MLSAYWKVATSRFVDVIVMGTDQVRCPTALLSRASQLQTGATSHLLKVRRMKGPSCSGMDVKGITM
jgi:hypothetical protein